MLSGVGRLAVLTQDLEDNVFTGGNIMLPGRFVDFTYTGESTQKQARAWTDGKLKVVSSAVGDESYSLTLAFEYLDWSHLGFAMDELPQVSSGVKVPIMKSGIANASGVITDAEIVNDEVRAYVSARGSWGEARYLKTTEFSVGTGTLTTSATFAGAPIEYVFNKTYANIESIGHEAVSTGYGKLAFVGMGYGPEFPKGVQIYLPSITRSSIPSIQTQDVPRFEINFSVNVPAGARVPHKFYNVATATA